MKIPTRRTMLTGAAILLLASSVLAAGESEKKLLAEAKIDRTHAERIALAQTPGGKIKSGELEKEHGELVWSFDISTPHSKNITEVQVDAKTGKIAAVEIETPKDQAKEKAADKKEKK
jgi:hypothetical protein